MLTKKEKQILELRRKGFKQVQIASRLKISQPAVSSFESNAWRKIRDAQKTVDFIKEREIHDKEE